MTLLKTFKTVSRLFSHASADKQYACVRKTELFKITWKRNFLQHTRPQKNRLLVITSMRCIQIFTRHLCINLVSGCFQQSPHARPHIMKLTPWQNYSFESRFSMFTSYKIILKYGWSMKKRGMRCKKYVCYKTNVIRSRKRN